MENQSSRARADTLQVYAEVDTIMTGFVVQRSKSTSWDPLIKLPDLTAVTRKPSSFPACRYERSFGAITHFLSGQLSSKYGQLTFYDTCTLLISLYLSQSDELQNLTIVWVSMFTAVNNSQFYARDCFLWLTK